MANKHPNTLFILLQIGFAHTYYVLDMKPYIPLAKSTIIQEVRKHYKDLYKYRVGYNIGLSPDWIITNELPGDARIISS